MLDLGPRKGVGRPRRVGSAAPVGGGRCGLVSSEVAVGL
jgi:hypothetical protein